MKKQACREAHCSWPSISQVAVCRYHWAAHNWGVEWADKCYPEHPHAQRNARATIAQPIIHTLRRF